MNPTYKIHGKERRKIKKELAELKSYVKDFWFLHQLDKDMAWFYGCEGDYPMSDEKAKILYDRANQKIKELESKLSELYAEQHKTK